MRLDQGNKTKSLLADNFLISFVIFCLLIDVLNMWGRTHFPSILGQLACRIQPLTVIAHPVTSNVLLEYVSSHCANDAGEPVPSIVFYMLKIVAALFAPIPFVLLAAITGIPIGGSKIRDDIYSKLNEKEGVFNYIKQTGEFLLGLLLFSFLLIYHISLVPAAAQFDINVFAKLVEDFTALTVFLSAHQLYTASFYVISFSIKRSPHGT